MIKEHKTSILFTASLALTGITFNGCKQGDKPKKVIVVQAAEDQFVNEHLNASITSIQNNIDFLIENAAVRLQHSKAILSDEKVRTEVQKKLALEIDSASKKVKETERTLNLKEKLDVLIGVERKLIDFEIYLQDKEIETQKSIQEKSKKKASPHGPIEGDLMLAWQNRPS